MVMSKKLSEVKAKLLSDPDVRAVYDQQAPEYEQERARLTRDQIERMVTCAFGRQAVVDSHDVDEHNTCGRGKRALFPASVAHQGGAACGTVSH